MASELEYLRKDRDRWIEAWRKSIGDAEQMRRCHEVEKNALLECIRKQDARITDLETRREMLREQMMGERDMRHQLHEDVDCVLARMEVNR
jgi:hypothetical protein